MPLITQLGLNQQSNYFGHAAPFHCFNGEYKGCKLAIVTNGKDRKFGCDNVRRRGLAAYGKRFLSILRLWYPYYPHHPAKRWLEQARFVIVQPMSF